MLCSITITVLPLSTRDWRIFTIFIISLLCKPVVGSSKIYILDEPTTGLHSSDIIKIVNILQSLVAKGNTVIVIEHNTDVMKLADYIIDIGPDGGNKGGQVVFTGTVKQMTETSNTITAQYLRKSL